MDHGDFHGFMKEYMEKTCPTRDDRSWCSFESELTGYRNLSKALKLCGYYSANLDEKIEEISQGIKDLKKLAKESKDKFNGMSTKERVEFSFKEWLTGAKPGEGVRQRASRGAGEGT